KERGPTDEPESPPPRRRSGGRRGRPARSFPSGAEPVLRPGHPPPPGVRLPRPPGPEPARPGTAVGPGGRSDWRDAAAFGRGPPARGDRPPAKGLARPGQRPPPGVAGG